MRRVLRDAATFREVRSNLGDWLSRRTDHTELRQDEI